MGIAHRRWRGRARAALCTALAALAASACGSSPAVDLPPAASDLPLPRALSRLATGPLDALLAIAARLGLNSGYVAMFARDGHVVHATTAGHADLEAGRPMQLETRFRLASMTKPVTAVAALMLIEDGLLALDDPVARYVPAAAGLRVAAAEEPDEEGRFPTRPLDRPLTVRDLLTFRAGIGARGDPSPLGRVWQERDIYAGRGPLADRVDRILSAPLYEQPGERWRYGWSADVLARVVEVAADEPFGQVVERRILVPLGMRSTSFLPAAVDRMGMATVYTQDESGDLVRVEHPRSDAADWTPGGSGLVSTAGDFMRFAMMLANGGVYDGARILSRESVEEMTRPHVPSGVLKEWDVDGVGWGMGVAVVVDADATPMIDRDGDFWWSGFYGTHFFVSPSTGLSGVVLTQNQPGPESPRPFLLHVAQALAFYGL